MRIDVHTHLVYPEFIKHLAGRSALPNAVPEGGTYVINCRPPYRQLLPLRGLSVEDKLRDMEAMGIDVAVLSHGIPGPELLGGQEADDWAARINDYLASVIAQYPGRFVGWGSIGFGSPERAVAEVERCITRLGFKGIQLFSNINNTVLDAPEFIPVYRHVARLGVPMNMHPTAPLNLVGMDRPNLVPGMGFIYDTSLGTVRLIQSGLFDQEPDLKLIVPHVGGILPYLSGRITRGIDATPPPAGQPPLAHPAQHYLDKLYFDAVGHSLAALEFCYRLVGAERLLFGTDHPFANYTEVATLVERLHCTAAEREMMYHGNAERLLRLTASTASTP
jgi:predicted TIM-barrel fold metal-dependent hydrolase